MTHNFEFEDEIPLDPTSEFYRICPHPECGKEHMVNHRSRVYCCDEHADDHYNMKRRIKKEGNLTENNTISIQPSVEQKLDLATQVNLSEKKEDTEQAQNTETLENVYLRNIEILDTFEMHPENGSIFTVDYLRGQGLNFSAFSRLGPIHNIEQQYNSRFMQMGSYRLYRVEYSHLLIKKIN